MLDVAVYGSDLYWTASPAFTGSDGVVSHSALDGSGKTNLATAQANPGGIAADASGAYWINHGTTGTDGAVLRRGPGDAAAVPIAEGLPGPSSLALDDTNVYWMTKGIDAGMDGAVYRKAKSGSGAIVPLAQMQPNATGTPFALAVVAGTLYWAPRGLGNTDGLVRSMLVGGGPITEYASDQVRPQAVTADDAFVYWTSAGNGTDGLVQKASLGTQTITQLAGALSTPLDLAIDGPALYFTTFGDQTNPGALYRLAR